MIRGDDDPQFYKKRYLKFRWNDASAVPDIGKMDFVPKEGAMRMFGEGSFSKENGLAFRAYKTRLRLPDLGRCAYCSRTHDAEGTLLPLTSEHIIAEALGANTELPAASCHACQKVTAEFESSVVSEMFDSVRRSFGFDGKRGVLEKKNFPIDLATTTSEMTFINERHHPTILTIPHFYPAAMYSQRNFDQNGLFNLIIYNINCRKEYLDQYDVAGFSTTLIDTARFCQMIAKIAHVACAHFYRDKSFKALTADFIRTNLPPKTPYVSHYNAVGRLWQDRDTDTDNLHEVDVGKIEWNGQRFIAARVRLFASLKIPSFHVAIGQH